MKKKNTPPIILFFDETMRDRDKTNGHRGLGGHRFVIVLSSK
jgi:hypothetical protein